MTEKFMGHCDSCSDVMRDVGRPLVRVVTGMEVTFRFCSDECRDAFTNRDDIAEIPEP